ncbi:PAS domain S-box protein [Flavobacterium sp.]|uniref:PAS domain S-box protein n=1 Tax=Flavobacterium sp. TaxID=239 RepID=UPI00391D3676
MDKETTSKPLSIAIQELIQQNEDKDKILESLLLANKQQKTNETAIRLLNAALEQKVIKRTAQYAFISQVNQAIVQAKDVKTLFRNSCQIALEFGQFKMAWIGSFDKRHKKITLLSSCGITKRDIKLFTDATYQPNGAQDQVLQTGKYYLCNDVAHDLVSENWKPYAEKQSIRSLIVLPIRKSGKIFGTINLYASERNFFDEEDIKLVTEVARDISFALDLFEKQERHKLVEALILKNEKRFRSLIENSADMITLSSREGKLLFASSNVSKLLGYPAEQVPYACVYEYIHPDDLREFLKKRVKLLESPGESFHSQIRIKHKKGTWIWCETTITNLLEEKDINALLANFHDISEKKSIEKQLIKKEAFNRGILDSLSSNIAVIENSGNIIAVNESWKRFAIENGDPNLQNTAEGINYFEVCRQSAKDGNEFANEVLQGMIAILEDRENDFYLEYPCHSPHESRWFGMKAIKFKSDVPMIVVSHTNISQRKLAEENLIQSEARLREAQALSHISNWEVCLATGIHNWSDEFYNLCGFNKEKILPSAEAFLSMIHPDDREFTKAIFEKSNRLFEAGSFNARIKMQDGTIRYIYSEWKFDFDQNQKPLRLFGILQDVTERKLAELEREKLSYDLIQRNLDLEQFTYIISHNLRAPTANIIGYTENLLDEENTPEEQKQLLNGMATSVKGLDSIIKDINAILAIKSDFYDKRELISLSKLVDDIANSIENIMDKHHVVIKADFSEIDKVMSLKGYMHSIFYNLISNSIKYSKPNIRPIINIKSKKEGNKITIHFQDNGLGIDLKINGSKIFGLYKRFHSHTEGKGLGLFMVKTQVEAIGGKISIASMPNKGTEFTIVFDKQAQP